MKWLKRILQNSDTYLQEGDIMPKPPIDNNINIGEPVSSFLKCVQENPRRFRLEKIKRQPGTRISRNKYIFTDKLTCESWNVVVDAYSTPLLYGSTIEWMTHEECRYVAKSISDIYTGRHDRLSHIRAIRYKRTTESERQRLIGVYCK